MSGRLLQAGGLVRDPSTEAMSQAILPVFAKLWHSDPATRIAASSQLVAHLQVAQKSATVATSQERDGQQETASPSAVKLDDGLADDVSYTLKRLIRGLASPRESSRLGFAVALTELLTRLDDILPRQVFPLLLSSSQLATGSKGQEERDLLFARLFGIHAVIASGLIFRSTSTLHDWRTAIEEVLYLSERKPWLRESAGWVVQGATRQLLARKDVEWRKEGLQAVVDAALGKVSGKASEWTPEVLALVILLQQEGFQADWDTITESAFEQPGILSSSRNLPALARILRGLSADESSKKANEQAQSLYLGTSSLHYVWSEILSAYFAESLPAETPKQKKAKLANGSSASIRPEVPFLEFFNATIDNNLLSETASISSKYIGLLAFNACISAANAEVLPLLFTRNVLRTLMNHLAKGDRTLHGVARQISIAMPSIAQKHPSIALDMLMCLYLEPVGTIRFDALTRTKTAEGIAAGLDLESTAKYATWLMQYVTSGGMPDGDAAANEDDAEMVEDDAEADNEGRAKALENRRSWAIDQFLQLVRRHAQPLPLDSDEKALHTPDYQWISRILQFLLLNGFFNVLKSTKESTVDALRYKPDAPYTASIQAVFRSRLFSALAHLITNNSKCRGEAWPRHALYTLHDLKRDSKHVTSIIDDEQSQQVEKAIKLLKRIEKHPEPQKAQYLALLTEILQLVACDPSDESEDFLEQAEDAVDALLDQTRTAAKASTSKDMAMSTHDDEDGEDAQPVSVLVDLLVNLMQKPSGLLRVVAERVFASASSEMGEQALQLLLDQISPEGTEEADEVEGELEEEESEAEEEEGLSTSMGQKRSHLHVDDSDADSSDQEDDEDEGDLDLDVDEDLRAKILEALKGCGVEEEDASEDGQQDDIENTDEQEEELLDDDQMMELDDKLADIFRSRKAASTSARHQQQAAHDAQLKIIDLLEIFAKQQSGSSLLLQVIPPLFDSARRSGNEDTDIASKANRVLTGIVAKPKEYPSVDDGAAVIPLLQKVHQGAQRTSSDEVESLAAATSLYLSKCAMSATIPASAQTVVDVYLSSLNSYLLRKSCKLRVRFFETFIGRFREQAWSMREALLAGCSEETTTKDKHRRAACFSLSSSLLASHAAIKTPEARKETVDFARQLALTYIATFDSAAKGEGMKLQVARLREILKACTEAVRATRVCAKADPGVHAWEVWKSERLSEALANVTTSQHITKAGSLSSNVRNLLDLLNQGSGRAPVRNVKKGQPDMLPVDSTGKPMTKLDQRQVKKSSKKEAARLAENAGRKSKKRKASDIDAAHATTANGGDISAANGGSASTSEDSDA